MALNTFINTLIENIPEKNLPPEIDLVLDGGAFNGVYMLGGLFYIKELEGSDVIVIATSGFERRQDRAGRAKEPSR